MANHLDQVKCKKNDGHIDMIDFDVLSIYQKLSEYTIHRYKDKLNWKFIAEYQTLSDEFIGKHLKYWYNINNLGKHYEQSI